MTTSTDELVIQPTAVSINPTYESDWLRALYGFVVNASKSGQTVRLTVEEKTYSPREAGQLLGVSRSTVQREIASGNIRARKRGSYYRIAESEITRLRQSIRDDIAELFANDF